MTFESLIKFNLFLNIKFSFLCLSLFRKLTFYVGSRGRSERVIRQALRGVTNPL
jgi:hypothetical protein